MKTPQRDFVVEYKSARRKASAPPSSIWGKTDIKSLVREAAAAHPFGQDVGPHALSDVDQKAPAPSPVIASAADDAGTTVQSAVLPQNTAENHSLHQDQHATVEEPSGSAKDSPEVGSKRAVRRRRDVASDHPAENSIKPVGKPPAAVEPVGLTDELVWLDVENQRLRGLMMEQLKAQNSQLRTMLARFEIG